MMSGSQHIGEASRLKLLVNRPAAVAGFCAALAVLSGCSDDAVGADTPVQDAAGGDTLQTDSGALGGDGWSGGDGGAAQLDGLSGDAVGQDAQKNDGFTHTDSAMADVATVAGELLCLPCLTDNDCAGQANTACVSYGKGGSFCATECSNTPGTAFGCPTEYDCRSSATVGGKLSTWCLRVDAQDQVTECACSALAVSLTARTACMKIADVAGEPQVCHGERACSDKGLSPCSAPDPATETCDTYGVDDDCDGQTDEATCPFGDPCATWACTKTGCAATFVDAACSDDDACTNTACAAGKCTTTSGVKCDDANECTADACAAKTGCSNAPIAAGCDDGNACTAEQACVGGVCHATKALDCDDKKDCTTDTCAPAAGCVHTPASTGSCDDGDICTTGDFCQSGACQKGATVDCDDGTTCTNETCDKAKGCITTPAKTATACACKEPDLVGFGADFAAFGAHSYSKYDKGTLPVILAAPHGGDLSPKEIPDRTVGVLNNDSNTRELTWLIARELALATGRKPHVVINRLARIKLDANREIKEAAAGNKLAEQAWTEFHAFIDTAKQDIVSRCGKGLFVDLHAHGHSSKWIELGYRLSAADLAGKDADIDGAKLTAKSSLRSLAGWSGGKHSALIRGAKSLGGRLQSDGYASVPSPKNPNPGGKDYFTGGYNTLTHGSSVAGSVDAVQVETHFSFIAAETDRQKYGKAVAQAILGVLADSYGITTVAAAAKPPENQACSKAEKLILFDGIGSATGSTTFAANEFGTAVSCGNGFSLDGPQLYYEVELQKGQTYAIKTLADFPARVVVVAKTCVAKTLQSTCTKSAIKGDLLSPNVAKSALYKAEVSGPHLVIIDSRAPQWHGGFSVEVTLQKGS